MCIILTNIKTTKVRCVRAAVAGRDVTLDNYDLDNENLQTFTASRLSEHVDYPFKTASHGTFNYPLSLIASQVEYLVKNKEYYG